MTCAAAPAPAAASDPAIQKILFISFLLRDAGDCHCRGGAAMIFIMSDWIEALGAMLGPDRQAEAGTTLFRQGDEVRFMYVVRSGCVQLVRWGEDGLGAVMQGAERPDELAV